MFSDITIDTNEEEEIPVGLYGEGSSLNAGVELEHEEIFVDPTPGEVPELAVDVEILVSLEARLDDLAYLRQDMERAHGMTQSFAMEAERILPGSMGVPVGYFTKTPTATRYTVATESLSKGVWALIAAAVAAVAAAIIKFYLWLSGDPKGDPKNPAKAAEKAQEQAAKSEEKAEQNEEVLRETPQRVGKVYQAFQYSEHNPKSDRAAVIAKPLEATLDSFVEGFLADDTRYERTKRFMQQDNPIFRDIITEGPYTKAFREVAGRLKEIAHLLQQREKMFGTIMVRDLKPHGTLVRGQNLNDLDVAVTPFRLRVGGKECTLSEAADEFAKIRMKAASDHTKPQPMSLDQTLGALERSYTNSQIQQFFQHQREVIAASAKMDERLAKFEGEMGNVANDGTPGKFSEGVGPAIRQAVFSFGQEFNAFRRLQAELYTYGQHLDRLGNESVGLVSALETRLFSLARTGKINLPDDWKLAAARESMSRYQTLFSHVNPAAHAAGKNWH